MNASEFYLDLMSLKGDEAEEDYEEQKVNHDKKILQMEEAYINSPFRTIEESSLEPI